MSIKLAVLQDQDQVIAEIKEVVDEGKPIGYLFGVPMIFIFVVGLAGLFTGRSAPMGVIFILTTIGIMAYMGYIDFENPDATWVLLLISAVIGVFIGKRYS